MILISTAHAATEAASNPGIVALFGLDIKLFIAQLINFGVIMFVLWKWVFTPLNNRLSERTKTIEDSLQTAEKIKEQQEAFQTWRKNEMEQARVEADGIISLAKTDAETVKQNLLNKAKLEQEEIVKNTSLQLNNLKSQALLDTKEEIANLITQATESILKTKLDSKKDHELIKSALEELS